MKILVTFILAFFALTAGAPALAQTAKHPRVMELEKELSRQGLEMLKGRFPGHPFMITVAIDPMMRERRADARGERLPSYDMVDEEIVDEWDDPNVPTISLLGRVKRIQTVVSIPAQLTDDEIGELRSALFSGLGLIEARDGMEIRKRNWSLLSGPENDWKNLLAETLLGALALCVLLGGLYAVSRVATDRLGKAYREAAQLQKSPATGGPSLSNGANNAKDERRGPSAPAGDLRFDDPIRTRERLASAIRLLEEHRSFPCLDDMILFDRFAQEDPARLGALLSEFSWEARQKIVSFSSGRNWLSALNEPGEVSLACVEVLNRCLRVQRNDIEKDWQELLTFAWRLEGRIVEFLHGLPTKDAFAVLSCLPKLIALPAAREAFPGAWAVLLDAGAVFEKPAPDRVQELKKKALDILPLRDQKSVEKYRREKELLSFVRIADPGTEKEIYTTAGQGSALHEMRPPFYPVFESSPEILDLLVPQIRVDEWALALFNTSRIERKEIEKRFSEKQRIRYFELLRGHDAEPPDVQRIAEARDHIGHCRSNSEQQLKNTAAAAPTPEEQAPEAA